MPGASTSHAIGRGLGREGRTDKLALYGTWDFKWPQNQELVIAFQQLYGERNSDLVTKAQAIVWEAIASWRGDPAPAIRWRAADKLLPAPADANSVVSAKGDVVAYDILVSFAALPLRVPRSETKPQELVVSTQTSELGCYAARVDYGVPTLFLGPDDRGAGVGSVSKWIAGCEFKSAAVHEFGHALGIPHMHQNPYWRRGHGAETLKEKPKIVEVLRADPRTRAFPESEIEGEIIAAWPSVTVDEVVLFSDWPRARPVGALEEVTCMAHPGWSRFLEGADAQTDPIKELEAATDFDRELLRKLYPPRALASVGIDHK